MSEILDKISQKYSQLGENPENYLKGLYHAKPVTYWDYVEVETLISLQRPRTEFKDEKIFIMYHQVTELMLQMMLHEMEQVVDEEKPDEDFLLSKVDRLNRYTSMLITSFDIMKYGMDYDDYNQFRYTLTPASGFQSAQFRFIEIYCTRLQNLVNEAGQKHLPNNPSIDQIFENIYWKDAGRDRKTGEKTMTLRLFEEKYEKELKSLARSVSGNSIEEKLLQITDPSEKLSAAFREFDYLYNVEWPMVHLETAQHYLDKKGENKAATGGSEWKKYLHPKYQQRKFFPSLWSEEEIENWGDGVRK
ncbi:tryptophan 2,3-dioxygenase family protein [Halocola ammonii]